MTHRMHDERAVRGAAALAAKVYWWAIAVMAALLAVKLLTRAPLQTMLVEAVAFLLAAVVVLPQRIRYGLWGKPDEAMTELLNLARARAFNLMGWSSLATMILGYLLDDSRSFYLYQTPCLMFSLMRHYVEDRCIREGWLHGVTPRSPRGWAAILRAAAIFLIGTAAMLGLYWLKAGQRPDTWMTVMAVALMALLAASSLSDRSMRQSEAAADRELQGVEWLAEWTARQKKGEHADETEDA